MPTDPVVPVPDPEPETIGDLIESIVGKAVPRAIADARKEWAKDLSDLLDLGADDSTNPDPANPGPNPAPVVDPAPVGVRGKRLFI